MQKAIDQTAERSIHGEMLVSTSVSRTLSHRRLINDYGFGEPGSISTANGSALVRIGDSTIVCGVKAEIAEPDLERPDQGFIGML